MYVYSIDVKNKLNKYYIFLIQMTLFIDKDPIQLPENQSKSH